ncbi:MAG: NAD(P)/FAD-dependent oxidoreductase [Actinobacteria bacterium]|nr:NAD(P)/FAD-dependent oxidoreductase [Actinomycetota bacterium]
MLPFLRPYRKWGRVSGEQVAARFRDPALAEVFRALWPPEMNFFFLIATMARMSDHRDGYPLGGSLPMARNVEQRYLELGGELRYRARVEKILVEPGPDGDRAVGVRLIDGTEELADVVVSAADGHATIFGMLGGRYVGDTFAKIYQSGTTFPALLFLGIGIDGTLEGYEPAISGLSLLFAEPLVAGSLSRERFTLHPYTHDPHMAPEGGTAMTVMIEADPDYWCDLRDTDRERYRAEKQRVADAVIAELERRWPGVSRRVEMVDVATPATTVRYTGNWKGSFEGWLATPEYASGELPRTLPGLGGFYMVGHWVAPGGGLPSGVMTARQVQQLICRADGVELRAGVPSP